MRPISPILLVVLSLGVGGCAGGSDDRLSPAPSYSPAAPSRPVAPTTAESLVATDLVSVLIQLPTLRPFSSTVQVRAPRTGFGAALTESLREAGYGLQRVDDREGESYTSFRIVRPAGAEGERLTYEVSIGGTRVERSYRPSRRAVLPTGPVKVFGVEPSLVLVNDDLFRQRGEEGTFVSGVVFHDREGRESGGRGHEVRVRESNARAAGERVRLERFLVLARANLFLADRLDDDRDADIERFPFRQSVLRFPEEGSLALGEENKGAIRELLSVFEAGTDRFVLTGCSHGQSLLWDGTEIDSLERSMRVKEELMIAGVSPSAIREHGCFEARYTERLPPRGVVVTLERRDGVPGTLRVSGTGTRL